MVKYIRSGMILTAFIAVVTISTPTPLVHASLLPANLTQVEQERTIRDSGNCLPHQYIDVSSLKCRNCTFCSPGTEHFPRGECGNGRGERTSCRACREGSFQSSEGYSNLKCTSCVTCHEGAKVIQNCTQIQDAICGDCPPGTYAFHKNVCLDCKENPTHEQCTQPTPTHPTLANQSALILPSLESLPSSNAPPSTPHEETAPPSSLPVPTKNTSEDNNGDQGTPTRTFSFNDVLIPVAISLILGAILYIIVQAYKRRKARNGSGGRLPTKQQTFQNASYGHVNVPTRQNGTTTDNSATADATTDNSATADATTDSSVTATGSGRPLPIVDRETASNAEESVALLREGEPGGDASARPESERLQGAGVPVSHSSASLLPSNVSINEYSLPGELASDGGPGGDAFYQHLRNNVPGSPDSAKDNFVFEDDEGEAVDLSHPKPLMS